ncbi:MAG: hypothetical protein WCT39_01520, partial [Candidatus Margulisiibacteriota bacterium]
QDLSHNQKHLFIVGLQDRYNPELYAWRVEGGRVYAEGIKIVSDIGVTVVDIATGKPQLSQNVPRQEMDRLAQMIDGLIHGVEPQYHKLNAIGWDASTFSTFA